MCVGNIFYIGDLSIIFNEVFKKSRLVFARNFVDHLPDCVCFGGRIKLTYIILPTDLFSLFNGFPCLCSEQFKLLVKGSFFEFAEGSISLLDCYFALIVKPECVASV